MMRIKLMILLLVLFGTSRAQQTSWKKLSIDQGRNYQVESLHEVVDFSRPGESPDTVRASLMVNDNVLDVIRFAKATCKNGNVTISIYETNEANDYDYVINISKNKYIIKFNFISSGESEDESYVVPYETNLMLNTSDFRPGSVIKGHTEFKGKCTTCKNEITVKGNFQVTLK
ncbi:MAG: hypothetical protein ACOYXT_00780 [Bacteroidota bacterium]